MRGEESTEERSCLEAVPPCIERMCYHIAEGEAESSQVLRPTICKQCRFYILLFVSFLLFV